jgi:F0F1-type ATP synthase epsilon subunit
MNDTIVLNIISHEGNLFSEEVNFFKCISSTGEIGVYPSHTDSIILLESTDLEYVQGEKLTKVFIRSGVLSITSNKALIFTDQLLNADDIEIDSVKESISKFTSSYNSEKEYKSKEKYRKLILESEAKLRVKN